MKNISSDPTPEPKKSGSAAKKKQYIVIEIPKADSEHSYPTAVFACETVEEALKLCKQMNTDAGYQRYGVQKPSSTPDK